MDLDELGFSLGAADPVRRQTSMPVTRFTSYPFSKFAQK